ncbi:MAG: carotenoid biosynthesis protein [Paludibacter sp.]|nr:carotenoid biosynthesis protein [Paludibacter sp.]
MNNKKIVKAFFIIFYLVGVAGTLIPYTSALFFKLIPFALILSFTGLLFFHETKVTRNAFFYFITLYLVSFFVEVIGVNTGFIFGNYNYGNSLGIKLFQTPLLIGVNWIFLVYTTASVMERFKMPVFAKIGLASVLMLIYDIVMEQIAPMLDMWHWENGIIPLQNYVAWLILALLFQTLLRILNVKIQNNFAPFIIVCQFLFFLFLLIANKLRV